MFNDNVMSNLHEYRNIATGVDVTDAYWCLTKAFLHLWYKYKLRKYSHYVLFTQRYEHIPVGV